MPILPGIGARTLDQVMAPAIEGLSEATKAFVSYLGPFISVPPTFTPETGTKYAGMPTPHLYCRWNLKYNETEKVVREV
jgi:hypothetical protein